MFCVFHFGPSQYAWSQTKTHETSTTSRWIMEYESMDLVTLETRLKDVTVNGHICRDSKGITKSNIFTTVPINYCLLIRPMEMDRLWQHNNGCYTWQGNEKHHISESLLQQTCCQWVNWSKRSVSLHLLYLECKFQDICQRYDKC